MFLSKSDHLEKAIDQIIDHQVGVYKNAWRMADPDAETDFAAWLDTNVKMAKKFKGSLHSSFICLRSPSDQMNT